MIDIDKIFVLESLDKNSTLVDAGDDTLALSVANHRLGHKFFMIGITVTDHDREIAGKIVDHFSNQLLLTLLRVGKLTVYQQSLQKYLEGDRTHYKSDQTGLVFSLPEFYYRDIKFGQMVDSHFKDSPLFDNLEKFFRGQPRPMTAIDMVSEITAAPVEISTRNGREGKARTWSYWLKEVNTGAAVMVDIPINAQLRYLWEYHFKRSEVITLAAPHWRTKQHPADLAYLTSTNWIMVLPE